MPLISDAEAFKTIIWKCYLLELNSVSKYAWSIASIIIVGYAFGMVAKYSQSGSFIPIVMNIFMFLMCGIVGRTIAINLIRDRKVKFRLTLQLVGVKQSVYLSANFFFAIMWGVVQVVLLLFALIFFAELLGDSKLSLPFSFSQTSQFLLDTVLFLLAYLAMCAAFSGLITQYDFSSEIISKFTFLGLFLPIAFVVSSVLNALSNGDPLTLNKITHISYPFIWLPNVSYLQLGIIKMMGDIKDIPEGFKPAPAYEFDLVLLFQFIGYLVLYYFIDRYFSNDTGGQRQILGAAAAKLQDATPVDLMDGLHQPLNPQDQHQNTIKIKGLVKKFGDFSAIRGVSLDINSNVITCLLGHNGAGKTTLIDILTGFQTPTEGGVYFNGRNIHTNIDLLYGNVGYASSHDPLFEEMRVRDFLALMARLKGVPNYVAEADRVANETHLQPHMYKLIKECSGGTKRRISISSSIVGNPPLIFLDEPSTGVDPENRRALWEAIWHMKKPNRIILLTTHHLEEAEFLSQDVIIMSKGQISVRGNPDQIKAELGVGYKIVLNNMKDRRQEFNSKFASVLPYFTIVEDRLQSIGEMILVMKRNTNDVVVDMLKQLTTENITFTILAASLEDAFINLGEMDETVEEEERRNEIIERLFIQKFETNYFNRLIALQIRKFFLLFRSMLQIIVVIMLISFPASVYVLIVSFAYSSINSFTNKDLVYRLEPYYMAIINIICIIYYTFSCGFFGLIPVVERVTRIRYLMKMNNVSPLLYYPTLFLPDAFIAGTLVMITYLVSYVATHDFYSRFSMETFFYLEGNLFMWILTFIAQSYCLSFLFDSKDTAYKRLTNVLLMMNLLAMVFMMYIYTMSSQSLIDFFTVIMKTLFPGYTNLYFCYNALYNQRDIQLVDMKEAMIYSGVCFAIFFPLAY